MSLDRNSFTYRRKLKTTQAFLTREGLNVSPEELNELVERQLDPLLEGDQCDGCHSPLSSRAPGENLPTKVTIFSPNGKYVVGTAVVVYRLCLQCQPDGSWAAAAILKASPKDAGTIALGELGDLADPTDLGDSEQLGSECHECHWVFPLGEDGTPVILSNHETGTLSAHLLCRRCVQRYADAEAFDGDLEDGRSHYE
jgi:hypothetical protein